MAGGGGHGTVHHVRRDWTKESVIDILNDQALVDAYDRAKAINSAVSLAALIGNQFARLPPLDDINTESNRASSRKHYCNKKEWTESQKGVQTLESFIDSKSKADPKTAKKRKQNLKSYYKRKREREEWMESQKGAQTSVSFF
jgi:hypothetical protein